MKECCERFLNEQFGGDADVVAEIYGEYASSCAAKLAEAKSALAAGDWTLLDRVAHTLKGNALAAGDEELAASAIELRKASALQDADASSALVSKLEGLAAGL